jgi:hypothetical protein
VIVPDAAETAAALGDLHRARRRNHRQNIHWVDALYRVYLTAFGALVATLVLVGQFPEGKIDASTQDSVVTKGPGWLGLVFALIVFTGLRSGSRGGPLALEAATVQHELLAPVDRAATLREPALKQMRTLAYAGALVGAIVGLLGARQTEANPALTIIFCGVAFSLAASLGAGCALFVSGHRIGKVIANGVGLLLVLWSVADIAFSLTTSPMSLLASVAFWSLKFIPLGIIGLLVAGAVIFLGVNGVGNTSLEQARRRAGLVSQLRFAVTLQDVRTVVLLRRQLAQETPRAKPWIKFRRGHGKLPPVWRRDWQSYFRFPVVRLFRMVALSVVAGLAIGFTWRGTEPAFLIAGIALYLAGYDAVEPMAQEVDHPTRWDSIPEPQGRVLLQHLPAALLVMLVVCGITTATTLLLVPPSVVGALVPILLVPVAAAATIGAAVSTSMGAPNPGKQLDELGADMLGFVQMIRLVLPPAMVVACLAPMLLAGSDPNAINVDRVQSVFIWPLVLLAGGMVYLFARKPSRL